ncbi:hypothetical protein SAMN04488123_10135 [Natribacillus halophilus]|uniref:Restriction endonuclease n=1 Tax=Natribacillus halophilus TaxID=549003 RepID=A0A1G8J5F4_9BACI|nr:hypothetical protein SAMN04488123_10135 [Natribacillus halophilus]
MRLPEEKNLSVEAFYKMREDTDHILEYADGIVFISPSPSPSTRHQQVSARLKAKLFNFLTVKNAKCSVHLMIFICIEAISMIQKSSYRTYP